MKIDIELLEKWINNMVRIELSACTKANVKQPEVLNNVLGKIESYENILNFLGTYKDIQMK
ncbi:hypothetical protein CHH83_02385 [Bacillus sp. 7586-K]|nr:hypothetical protein CHH83_02385 [Bacillus sp. 7586-K]